MNNKANQTRLLLLQAANRLIIQSGIQHLTLEAVAAAAGVSKGGLLYHYPSKEALIIGMLDFNLDQFERRLQAHLLKGGSDPKSWLRAYVLATLEPDPDEFVISAGLMAAVGVNSELLNPMRERYRQWQVILDQTAQPSVANLIRLTLDGWWISNLLGLAPITDAERERLQTTLLNLIEEQL